MARRSRLVLGLKLILGLILIALLLRGDTLPKLGEVLASFRWAYVGPLLVVTFLLLLVSCLKWQAFLRERGATVSLWRLLGLYTVGNFFSNFLPSQFGGDVVRGYVLGRQIESQSRSMASVFLERFTGLIALVIVCLVTLAFRPSLLADPLVAASVGLMVAGCVGLLVLLAFPGPGRRVTAPLGRTEPGRRVLDKLAGLREEIVFFARRPRTLAGAMVYSVVFHGLAGVNTYLAARAIGLEAPFLVVVALTPLILLVASVPLTPNGLGIWEWAYAVFLGSAGGLPEQGLAVALVLRGEHILTSLIGGVVMLFERGGVEPDAHGDDSAWWGVVRRLGRGVGTPPHA